MLKIKKDITLIWGGVGVEVKEGETIDVGKKFKVDKELACFLERRFIEKFPESVEKVEAKNKGKDK